MKKFIFITPEGNTTAPNGDEVENMQVIVIQHGRYFSSYSNLTGVTVHRGQDITTGQVLGKVAANIDGIGAMDFLMSSETSELDPERWLRSR